MATAAQAARCRTDPTRLQGASNKRPLRRWRWHCHHSLSEPTLQPVAGAMAAAAAARQALLPLAAPLPKRGEKGGGGGGPPRRRPPPPARPPAPS